MCIRDRHDGCDDFQTYFINGIDQIQEWSSFFTDCDQCETDDQGKYQNLKHVSVGKCSDGAVSYTHLDVYKRQDLIIR